MELSVELSYSTQCQLRASSLSISESAVQCCSSMKTDFRIIIASLKIVGLVLVLVSWVGSTSFSLGPGGGCIEVLRVGFGAILFGNGILNVKGLQW